MNTASLQTLNIPVNTSIQYYGVGYGQPGSSFSLKGIYDDYGTIGSNGSYTSPTRTHVMTANKSLTLTLS